MSVMNMQNPHDKYFKDTFGNIRIARSFIKNYFAQEIINLMDISTLRIENGTYIDNRLKEYHSDILFSADMNGEVGYIYLLFEHKSYLSKDVSLQLLKYIINIWEYELNKVKKLRKRDKLPIIIPLVIYHGKNSWNISNNLGEMIENYYTLPENLKRYIPNYEYILYDISQYKDEDIKGNVYLRIVMSILRDIYSDNKKDIQYNIYNAAKCLNNLKDKETAMHYFETYVRYVLNASKVLGERDITQIIDDIEYIYPEGSEVVMTIADILREEGMKKGMKKGIQKGMQKGIQKGKKDALVETAINLLTKRFGEIPSDIIERINQLEVEDINMIIDSIFEFQTIEDVEVKIKK